MKVHIVAKETGGRKVAAGIRLDNLPKNGVQHIHINALERHKDYVTIERDAITYHTLDGDVVFNVDQEPGRYCMSCGERLPEFAGNGKALEKLRAEQCRDHVATHGNKAAKTPDWPHGYVNRPQTYVCSIDDQRGA